MAQVDVQWPSEDEDFDAVIDAKQGIPGAASDSVAPQVETPSEPEEAPEAPEVPEETPAEEPEPAKPEIPDVPPAAVVTSTPSKGGKGGSVVRTLFEILLVAGLAGLGLWAWTLHSDNQDLKKQVTVLNNNPQIAVQKQTQELITAVSKLMQLPSGETPTVANVSDATQAKQQSAFFKDAQNGDKVLMYVKAGQAILYRPSTNKIVLVAPLTFNEDKAAAPASTTPSNTNN